MEGYNPIEELNLVLFGCKSSTKKIFTFLKENFKKVTLITITKENAKVRYISDSNHQWKYGDPFNLKFKNIQKLQLLIHPDNWTKSGENNIKNFKHLIKEKNQEIRDTFK
tara:strand:- start:14 stop:343 length:330 start_codon:yes stop_codon:yes gene_type:complete